MFASQVFFITTLTLCRHAASISEDSANSEDWLPMPDGRLYHSSCIHAHESHFDIGIESNTLGPCPFPTRTATLRPTIVDSSSPSYYSDWTVYAQVANDAGFSKMTSSWIVPAKPRKRGPADQSAVYIFNGLEDGGGHHGDATLILQPVLQYGKSGCLLNPLKWGDWHFTAYLVDGNGRAHCGPHIKVSEGDTVVGTMLLSNKETNTWTVTADVASNSLVSSSYSATLGNKTLDAAYLTLEGMVIYNCAALPPGNGTTFRSIAIADHAGHSVALNWVPKIRHNECAQAVMVGPNGSVTLHYDSTL